MIKVVSKIGDRDVAFEAGKIAGYANGVVVRAGGTVLLCTAVIGDEILDDFSPISVQYIEKFSAVNKVPGGYRKREGAPGDGEVLIARIIDRAFRPLIDKTITNEVQLTVQVFSYDGYACDVLAIAGCSLALNLAGVLDHFVAATKVTDKAINCRVVEKVGYDFVAAFGAQKFEVLKALDECKIGQNSGVYEAIAKDARTEQNGGNFQNLDFPAKILMLEFLGLDSDEGLLKSFLNPAIKASVAEILNLHDQARAQALQFLALQAEFMKKADTLPHLSAGSLQSLFGCEDFAGLEQKKAEILEKFEPEFKKIEGKFLEIAKILHLQKRDLEFSKLKRDFLTKFSAGKEKFEANFAFNFYCSQSFTNDLLSRKIRLDGRKYEEIREINMEVKILPQLNGSALFTRGDTQALVSVTLGGVSDQQLVESIAGYYKEKFMLHYNFLPYSCAQVGKIALSRREIGHGELAKKAFISVLPPKIDRTIRVVSEITSSNGSSSMATVCAASLAMFDAGVLDKHVAGISIGLCEKAPKKGLKSTKNGYKLLVDINAFEDQFGSMDFKVAGTKQAITAMQLDIKNDGISREILEKALKLAVKNIKEILTKMTKVIKKPSELVKLKKDMITVQRSQIKLVIGKGGAVVNALCKEFDLKIDVQNSGKIFLFGVDESKIKLAVEKIQKIISEKNIAEKNQKSK